MAFHTYDDLNDTHIDVLREIGNIGAGNAASALASMLVTPVDISVPEVSFLDYGEVEERLGGPEQMIVGLLLFLEGDVEGMIMFLLHQDFANSLLTSLLGQTLPESGEFDEMSYSAIQEVANIMAGSYANAISDLTGLSLNITVPSMCVDMVGAILSVPAVHFADISDKILFISDEFSGRDLNAPNHVLLMPDMVSLEKIMTNLGIEL